MPVGATGTEGRLGTMPLSALTPAPVRTKTRSEGPTFRGLSTVEGTTEILSGKGLEDEPEVHWFEREDLEDEPEVHWFEREALEDEPEVHWFEREGLEDEREV